MEENIKKLLKERTELEAKFAKMKKDLADNLKYIDEDFESYRSKDLLTKDEQLARFEQIKKEYTTKAEADMNAVKAEIDKINENITSKIITLRGEWAKKLNHEIDLAEKQEQLALAKKELDEAEAEYNHNLTEYFYRDNSTVTSLDDSRVVAAKKKYALLKGELEAAIEADKKERESIREKIEKTNKFFDKLLIQDANVEEILGAVEGKEAQKAETEHEEEKEPEAMVEQGEKQTKSEKKQEEPEVVTENEPSENVGTVIEGETIAELNEEPTVVKPVERMEWKPAQETAPNDTAAHKKEESVGEVRIPQPTKIIGLREIETDLSTGMVTITSSDGKKFTSAMGNEFVNKAEAVEFLHEQGIEYSKGDPYMMITLCQAATWLSRKMGQDKNKILKKFITDYETSISSTTPVEQMTDAELESVAMIRYFKSEKKLDKNVLKALRPYIKEAKNSTCAVVDVDARTWFEKAKDFIVAKVFNKHERLEDGKHSQELKKFGVDGKVIEDKQHPEIPEKSFVESLKVRKDLRKIDEKFAAATKVPDARAAARHNIDKIDRAKIVRDSRQSSDEFER